MGVLHVRTPTLPRWPGQRSHSRDCSKGLIQECVVVRSESFAPHFPCSGQVIADSQIGSFHSHTCFPTAPLPSHLPSVGFHLFRPASQVPENTQKAISRSSVAHRTGDARARRAVLDEMGCAVPKDFVALITSHAAHCLARIHRNRPKSVVCFLTTCTTSVVLPHSRKVDKVH